MNKLARYLNHHLLGEVTTAQTVRAHHATDNSMLEYMPEMVAMPLETSDIRKLASFADQLALKGHVLPLTPRGSGTDTTGGSLGTGIAMSLSTHMNRIFEYDTKQRLVRLQPGVKVGALRESLSLFGVSIPVLASVSDDATTGGVIASRYPSDGIWAEQLEVVLANGDVIQTKRLSKRELAKYKAKSGFEGKLYRELDSLLTDNQALLSELEDQMTGGYYTLSLVRQKDGSFDLSPLLYGSQGTLGIISEMIVKAEFKAEQTALVVAAFGSPDDARDVLDGLEKYDLGDVCFFDKTLVTQAEVQGKSFPVVDAIRENHNLAAVITVRLSDIQSRSRAKKIKKLTKLFAAHNGVVEATEDLTDSPLRIYENLSTLALQPLSVENQLTPVLDGAWVPSARLELFFNGVADLAKKHGIEFGLFGRPLREQWSVKAEVATNKMSGRQASLKILNEFTALVTQCGGSVAGQWAEGRSLAQATQQANDDRLLSLYASVKQLFDPQNILNPTVKKPMDQRQVVSNLRSSFEPAEPDRIARF